MTENWIVLINRICATLPVASVGFSKAFQEPHVTRWQTVVWRAGFVVFCRITTWPLRKRDHSSSTLNQFTHRLKRFASSCRGWRRSTWRNSCSSCYIGGNGWKWNITKTKCVITIIVFDEGHKYYKIYNSRNSSTYDLARFDDFVRTALHGAVVRSSVTW
jgi:hypothetical protein